MNSGTEPVLEVLATSGDWRSPSDIIVNMREEFADPPSDRTVYRALDGLVAHFYTGDGTFDADTLAVSREIEGYGSFYQITYLGRAYLRGDVDGGDFEPAES